MVDFTQQVCGSSGSAVNWNQVFADPVVASAIVDRLLHNASVLNIRGHSYRMRGYTAQQKEKEGGVRVR